MSTLKTEDIRRAMLRSLTYEADCNSRMADRWELAEDFAVGADFLIDLSAIGTGAYRYVSTGQLKEGFAGFGYLAAAGMAFLAGYFIARVLGEEPYKRRARYLVHMLGTPITLHRKSAAQPDMTFQVNGE